METPTKVSLEKFNDLLKTYLTEECSHLDSASWKHKCGAPLFNRGVFFSIHNDLFSECSGSGHILVLPIPYCTICEHEPEPLGCIHVRITGPFGTFSLEPRSIQ